MEGTGGGQVLRIDCWGGNYTDLDTLPEMESVETDHGLIDLGTYL